MSASYVCLICLPHMSALYVCLICLPHTFALYVCLIHPPCQVVAFGMPLVIWGDAAGPANGSNGCNGTADERCLDLPLVRVEHPLDPVVHFPAALVCVDLCVDVRMCGCMCMDGWMYVDTYACIYGWMDGWMDVFTHTHTHTYSTLPGPGLTSYPHIHTHTHTHTHTLIRTHTRTHALIHHASSRRGAMTPSLLLGSQRE